MPKKTENTEKVIIPVEEAAERLGMSAPYLRARLQEGQLQELGFAIKSEESSRWSYFIYRQSVERFLERSSATDGKIRRPGSRLDQNSESEADMWNRKQATEKGE